MRGTVHLLHIGKTGGTALKAALRPWLEHGPWRIVLHPHAFTLRDVPVGDKAALFLRDPLARFASGFNSRLRQGRPRYHRPWSPEEAHAFLHFETPDALGRALSGPDPKLRARAEAAMRAIVHVNTSYYDWIESDAYLAERSDDVLLIGFQESLTADFARLKTLLELPEAALPTDDLTAHRNPDTLDRSLDEQAAANLRRWYAHDIALVERLRN
jgi:hypothetical protein